MNSKPPTWLFLLLFLFSGAAGLVYELVWTRELIFVFGGTTYAITTVLVAFMGGLGLGSYVSGRFGDRMQRPGFAYGVLEILIGLYALLVPMLLEFAEPLYRSLYGQIGQQPGVLTGVRFAASCAILLVPTTLMGATLPLLLRFVVMHGGRFGQSVALLYGINSLGAVMGVLLSGFVLIPMLGLSATTQLAAAVNVLIGVTAIGLLRARASGQSVTEEKPAELGIALDGTTRWAILAVFAISGFTAMVYQVNWTRALVMTIGSSTYSFTCILAAFILGLAAGSFAVARFVDRWRNPALVIGVVQVMIGVAALVILPIYGQLPSVVYKLTHAYGASAYELLLTFEFLIVIGVTFVPTFLMGAMFPIVTRAIARHANDRAAAVGRAYGINTIGTILGSGLAGFVFLDWMGVQFSIAVASVLNAAAGAALLYHQRAHVGHAGQRAIPSVVCLAGVTLIALFVSVGLRWNPLVASSGAFIGNVDPAQSAEEYELDYVDDGVDLTVMVAHTKLDPDELIMTVNGKSDASTNAEDMMTQLMLGHVPALLAPKIDNTCVIGLGCGMTVAAVLQHPEVKTVDCIEISDGVIGAASLFSDFCDNVLEDDKRLNMIRADGRNHLLLTDQTYDLIISEPSNPWITGVSNLFTTEFFELCDARLADDGVVCVWLHSYGMAPADFRMVVRTVSSVFGYVTLWSMGTNDFALVAGHRPFQTPLSTVLTRFHQADVWADLYRMGLGRPEAVLGRMYSDGEALREWAGAGALNTDNNALLEFSAPRHIYRGTAPTILGEILAIRRSPFERAIRVDQPDDPVSSGVVRGVSRVMAARLKRAESATAFGAKHPAQGIGLLVQSYQLDPTSVPVYFELVDLDAQLQQVPERANDPAIAAHMNRFKALPPPVCSTRKNPSLEKLVRTLRRDIQRSERSGQWMHVTGYANELLRITPRDGKTLIRVARALVRLGENEAAAAVLKSAIDRQVLGVDQVREHEVFSELAGIDGIRDLLDAAGK